MIAGFIAFRGRSLEGLTLRSRGFEIETELLLEAWRNGLLITQKDITVPVISKSKLSARDMIKMNMFFDLWVLRNLGRLPIMKQVLFTPFCIAGFALSCMTLLVSGQR